MAKKYDTNPLDPEFPERAKQTQTATRPNPTRQYAESADTEEQTRKFNRASFASYAPPSDTEPDLSAHQTSSLSPNNQPDALSRKVSKVGLPENLLVALPYFPFSVVGLIAGILELLFVPKSEAKVRFHAAQGAAAHIGILIVISILGFADNFINLAGVASWIFWLVTTIMLAIFAYKAWKGDPVHIEPVDGLTNWLEDKINPWN